MDGTTSDRRRRFAQLHLAGCFVLPNAWDVGSARILESVGALAIATTSSGLAASLGTHDQHVTRDQLLAHVEAMCGAVSVPVSVDGERLYVDAQDRDPADRAADTVRLLAAAGAASVSVEDYQPDVGLLPVGPSAELVAAAADAAHAHGMTLTARAENHLYGVDDLDDTIGRLLAYRDAGADVVYAPGPSDPAVIRRLVEAVDAPVNVLARPGGPTVDELAELGVRRVSVGGALAFAAYGALAAGARELLTTGTYRYADGALSAADRAAAFDPSPSLES